MYVIEVIPLTRGSNVESLTYYGPTPYESGSIIEVPLRKKKVSALVATAKPVSAAKAAVRAATFTLRKLPEQTNVRLLPPALIETAKALTKSHPAHIGAILYALLPPEVRDGSAQVQYTTPVSHADIRPEIAVLEGALEERFIEYRSKIREIFAHRGSVLFVVPTSADIDRAVELLSQGIENRLVVFSPTQSKKRLDTAYRDFYDLTNAKLIITTPTHAYLDRHDLTHIIVDQSRSRHYKAKMRPYLDHREGLKVLAYITNRTMTLGDILPSSEDEYLRREEMYATLGEHTKRVNLPAKLEIIQEAPDRGLGKPFELFSPKLQEVIKEALDARERIFIYAARRGIAPVVICGDCGHIFRDPDSGAPYSLFQTTTDGETVRWFLSAVSGKRVRAADTCDACGSWRLRERGVGIQHIASELTQLFRSAPVFLFDHTTATTHKKAQVIMSRYYDAKSAILLGTQMVLPYLERPADISVITSHDATRAVPSWRAEEEFLALLLTLRERTARCVYLQMRTEPDALITYAAQGAVEQFYTEELQLRKALHYPPFTVLILLTWQDTKDGATKTEQGLIDLLKEYSPRCYSAPQSIAAKTRRHCLIRIARDAWPEERLIERLRSIPPNVKVEINPERIV